MEVLVRASDVDWTIVRPSGLYHLPSVTNYRIVEGHADGRFTARVDLAASMLAMLDDDRYRRTTVSVVTTVHNPTLLRWIRSEAAVDAARLRTPTCRRAHESAPDADRVASRTHPGADGSPDRSIMTSCAGGGAACPG
jgi:hypothetical protein